MNKIQSGRYCVCSGSTLFAYIIWIELFWKHHLTGPRSAVCNVSGYICVYDCRSRGCEFYPGPVPYFCGNWSWNNFYGLSPLPLNESFKKCCCQLRAKVCARRTGKPLVQVCPGKSMVRWTDLPVMTIAVDWDVKQQNKQTKQIIYKPVHKILVLLRNCAL